ncbi:unnamed protein product [Symbiodinium necroappetens]|uniref:Uncharacterized protein n=1 Tax=Symbiodinium necroappetens TaxID=1628268 RepID=A0A813ASX7_9DINO|nr:unnamed protein product [Symbiodinium necroappetens]
MHESYKRWAPQVACSLEEAWQPPRAPQLGRPTDITPRSLEAVALAAAADTTARIRAASTCSTRTPSGVGRRSVSAVDDVSPEKTIRYGTPFVAAMPLTPLWPILPCMKPARSDSASPSRSQGLRQERDEAETLRRHKEDLQLELADLRKRLGQMQDLCSELQEDNAHLKKALAEREQGEASLRTVLQEERQRSEELGRTSQQVRQEMEQLRIKFGADFHHVEDLCKKLEMDKQHLRKALRQREQGEISLRSSIEEEQHARRDLVKERESLKLELRKMQQLQQKAVEAASLISSRRSSSTSSAISGSGMIEVDLTGELSEQVLQLSDLLTRAVIFIPLFLYFLMSAHRASVVPNVTDGIVKALSSKPLVTLGNLAFPIFVVHGPLGQVFYKKVIATKLFGGTMMALVGPQFFYAYLAIVLMSAWVLQKTFLSNKQVGTLSKDSVEKISQWFK